MKRVGLCKTLMMLGVLAAGGMSAKEAKASTIIFAAFTETGTPALSYSNATGQLTGTNVAATFNDQGSGVLSGFSGNVLFNLSATRTVGAAGDASISGFTISQQVFGTLVFKSGTTTVLNMVFSGSVLSGFSTTGHVNGTDSILFGQAVAFQSDLQNTFTSPLSFSIALSTDSALALGANNNLAAFNASAAGNFTETITGGAGQEGAPLPAAIWGGMSLMGALGGVGVWMRRRRA